jgi:glycosyltransferase involved in cell wall biosynthesis
VSQAAAARYVSLKAVPARKSSVITNGIDIMEFAPSREHRARMREEMGAGDEFIWLTAGRIVAAKDYPNLLKAFAMVNAEYSETQLWVAGDGDVDDLSDLILKADELKMRGHVRWLGLRRDMPALLDAADGFVLASAWEGMPLVVGEAMAMEKPVVATDVGGVRELLGETGMIVPAKSSGSVAEAMLEMMRKTNDERRRMGRAACERIAAHFSMDAKAEEWQALYRKLLA